MLSDYELNARAVEICAALGDRWSVVARNDNPRDITDGAVTFVVGNSRTKGRIALCAVVDAIGKDGKNVIAYSSQPPPSITVAADRAPDLIAKCVRRRLLPDLARYTSSVSNQVQAHNDYLDAGAKASDELGLRRIAGTGEGVRHISLVDGRVCVKADGSGVDVSLYSVPVAVAKQLLQVLQPYMAESQGTR